MNESLGDRLTAATKRLADNRQAQQDRARELGKTVGPHQQGGSGTGESTNTGQ